MITAKGPDALYCLTYNIHFHVSYLLAGGNGARCALHVSYGKYYILGKQKLCCWQICTSSTRQVIMTLWSSDSAWFYYWYVTATPNGRWCCWKIGIYSGTFDICRIFMRQWEAALAARLFGISKFFSTISLPVHSSLHPFLWSNPMVDDSDKIGSISAFRRTMILTRSNTRYLYGTRYRQ